jgi:hypothetical protein
MSTPIVSINFASQVLVYAALLQRTRGYDNTPIAVADGPALGSEIANNIKWLVLSSTG